MIGLATLAKVAIPIVSIGGLAAGGYMANKYSLISFGSVPPEKSQDLKNSEITNSGEELVSLYIQQRVTEDQKEVIPDKWVCEKWIKNQENLTQVTEEDCKSLVTSKLGSEKVKQPFIWLEVDKNEEKEIPQKYHLKSDSVFSRGSTEWSESFLNCKKEEKTDNKVLITCERNS
ncbi:hypothetical protein MSUIS_01180 [Mycoplasma suis KI3806]|uniref:Uncharacterized protein n=1 Tax=Mycoplasma suis (strain KI_3806) TaxID=708248 RepID=F0V2Y9_MYCS3|nr:hypothetical protein [Mycoplasma suis]CBZ40211.1 hypothetical protein MSUIS_01180 [Mycoplasma suis KI3806]